MVNPTRAWYWRQARYNNFQLRGPKGEVLDFGTFDALCKYCAANDINAVQD